MYNRFKIFIFVLLLTIVIASASVCGATDNNTGLNSRIAHIFKGYLIDFGISFKELSLDIYEHDSTDSLGTLTSRFRPSLFFNAGTPYKYFKDFNFGYNFILGYSNFDMKTQEVDLDDVDLGTSANGYYLYAMPTLFYNLGDKAILNGKGHSFKLGIGAGIGYLKTKGDIIFTNYPSQERHIFNVESLSWAYSVMFDYRFNRWIFRVTIAGPEITKGAYEYNLFDISMNIGYSFGS